MRTGLDEDGRSEYMELHQSDGKSGKSPHDLLYMEYWEPDRYVRVLCCLLDAKFRHEDVFCVDVPHIAKVCAMLQHYSRFVDIEEGRFVRVTLYARDFVAMERVYAFYSGSGWEDDAVQDYQAKWMLGRLETRDAWHKSKQMERFGTTAEDGREQDG